MLGIEISIETVPTFKTMDFAKQVEIFEETIIESINLIGSIDITLLVDKVDDIWNSDKESEVLIIGLIGAVHSLNISLNNIKIIVFLRSAIYDSLRFNESDKLRSMEERISWGENDLIKLISFRGKISANITHLNIESIWRAIFPSKINQETSAKYFLDRTLRRPRELIQFCNLSLQIAQDYNLSSIDHEVIFKAEKQYSKWKLIDLINEYRIQYPFLSDILSIFHGFQSSFSHEDINNRFDKVKTTLLNLNPILGSIQNNTLWQILFNIGFIGVRDGSKNIFFYDNENIAVPQYDIMLINKAFHKEFGLDNYLDSINHDIVVGNIIVGDANYINIGSNITNRINISGSITTQSDTKE